MALHLQRGDGSALGDLRCDGRSDPILKAEYGLASTLQLKKAETGNASIFMQQFDHGGQEETCHTKFGSNFMVTRRVASALRYLFPSSLFPGCWRRGPIPSPPTTRPPPTTPSTPTKDRATRRAISKPGAGEGYQPIAASNTNRHPQASSRRAAHTHVTSLAGQTWKRLTAHCASASQQAGADQPAAVPSEGWMPNSPDYAASSAFALPSRRNAWIAKKVQSFKFKLSTHHHPIRVQSHRRPVPKPSRKQGSDIYPRDIADLTRLSSGFVETASRTDWDR
ncbi:hypothetical protein FB451DRAFT_1373363 [Mycena latifolia]|nr:hypothetical protein FB451DRAFT_1373363 [Mycena latifolia]